MNYFNKLETVEEIKFTYRKLCMKFHPDRPDGSTEVMQQINQQYQHALKSVHGKSTASADGESHTYYYNADVEAALMEVINQLLKLRMQKVEVALIGTWIWIIGSTMPYKSYLKQLGCYWHSKRHCWYFHTGKHRTRHSGSGLVELGEKYGFKKFTTESPSALVH